MVFVNITYILLQCFQKFVSNLSFLWGYLTSVYFWITNNVICCLACIWLVLFLKCGGCKVAKLGINVKSQRFSVNLFFDTDSLWYVIWNRFRFCLYFYLHHDRQFLREKEKEGRRASTHNMFVVNVDIEEYRKSYIATYIVI